MALPQPLPAAGLAVGRRRPRRGEGGRLFPYLAVGPVALLVALGVLYPIGYVVVLSTHDYSPFQARAMQFVGAGNYRRLLADPEFWASLQAGAIWVTGSVVPQFLLGLAMALVLNERFRGRGAVRTIVLVPWVVSGVVTGIIWTWLFDGTVGVVNDLLMRAGLVGAPVAWMVQPATTWLALFVANAWRGAPFFAIVLLAALQSISPDVYEAARIDGAGAWQRFRFVTLPLVLGTVILATLLRALWTFNFLDLIWTMTRGGPANLTRTMPLYIFDKAYTEGDFGYAATVSCVLCLVLLGFSAVYWQLHRLTYEE